MIEMMIKDVFENRSRINTIAKHISKSENRNCLLLLLLSVNLYLAARVIDKHEKKINELELKLEGIETKGE